jgi:hypothetical protein
VVTHVRALIALVLTLAGPSLPVTVLAAQAGRPVVAGLRSSPQLGLGYVANIPTTFLGFSALGLTPKLFGGAGLYADVKLTTSSPGDDPYYLPNVTVTDAEVTYGDMLYEEKSDWLTVNAAAVYAITQELAVYGGLGYAKKTHYRQYYDASQTRGNFGFYWISDPSASGTRVNALGGALMRITRHFVFQLGAESQPAGANVGVAITLHP